MKLLMFCILVAGAVVVDARAQISVEIRMEKKDCILYESIPVAVILHNGTGRTLSVKSADGKPWLEFLITSEGGEIMRNVASLQSGDSVEIRPGETVTRTIDILPLYDLRSHGTYQVQATVNADGMQAISSPSQLIILNGRSLWSQSVGLSPSGKEDEYRTYSLVAKSSGGEDLMYVRVEDEPHQLVFGMVSLGAFLTVVPPAARIDQQGDLHVLYQNGPRSFGYVQVDRYGKLQDRAAYSDFLSRPQLVALDGSVSVRGGERTYPKRDRVITNEDLRPAAVAPAPKPKKKWWWPFGPASSSSAH